MPYSGKNAKPCSIKNCPGLTNVQGASKGWCKRHYKRWLKYGGDPSAGERRRNGQGSFRQDGYLLTHANGRRVRHHRAVMEAVLGRPLLPSEVVHHRDGNPANNRPDNLEVHTRASHMRLHKLPKPRQPKRLALS